MKKKLKVILTTALITICMSTTALAYKSPVDDLKQALIQIGVPSNSIGNIVDYLQRIKVNKKQANELNSKINEVKALIGNNKDLSSLPSSSKAKLQKLAIQAGNIIGLNVKFSKNASGVTTVVVTTSKGGTLVQLNTLQVMELVKEFDISLIEEVVQEAIEFSNNKDKHDLDGDGKPDKNHSNFKPEGGGNLNDTAVGYGDMMVMGSSIIGMAGGVHLVSRRKK